jgi:formylglycine-generating enzyme required for sulfatase activity
VPLPSLLELTLLFAPLLGAAPPRLSYSPPPDPGPSDACPSDMRLVDSHHHDDVEHLCIDWHKDIKRCWGYYPEMTIAQGEPSPMRFCMDTYEAPNRKGQKPLVMKTFPEAAQWCAARKKRLCSEFEWETACESGDERPWVYGWKLDKKVCNSDKAWRAFDEHKLQAGGEAAREETERLWQGAPSGEYDNCRTAQGVHDLTGNVEEWVTSSRPRKFRGVLMGGFWAKPWTGCRGTNDAHEPTQFKFYEVGFRCCQDAAAAAETPSPGAAQGP